MAEQTIEVWVCATRNWIDPDGKGHGPRFTTVSADRCWAEASAASNNKHPVAGASKWFAQRLVETPFATPEDKETK